MPSHHLSFIQRDEQSEAQDLLSEVPLVQFGFENCLIEMLELRTVELRRQQLKPDRLISHFGFKAGAKALARMSM
jgi:hypothetical protein